MIIAIDLTDQRRDHAKAGLIIHFLVIVHSLANLPLYNLHDQEVASLSHLSLPDHVHLYEVEPAFLSYEVGMRLRAVCFNVDNIHHVHVVHHVLNSHQALHVPYVLLLNVLHAHKVPHVLQVQAQVCLWLPLRGRKVGDPLR